MTAAPRPVAVFEAGLPPGLAFIRSLGRAGVPVHAYGMSRTAAGRYSRYVERYAVAPNPERGDRFLEWLEGEVEREGIELVAPTSDYVAFALAEYDEQHGTALSGGVGGPVGAASVRGCLFKHHFGCRMERIGFPTPAWHLPLTSDDAAAAASSVGYPVVVKPRSHIGVGVPRGVVADDDRSLRDAFVPYPIADGRRRVLRHDADIATPFLQELIDGPQVRVVSVGGHVDHDGTIRGVECTRKRSQWGDRLTVGTMFDVVEAPPFLDHVLDAVRQVLRAAVFEFEVLVDEASGRYWALELNPRGFGQMSLSIERGSDLPALWYRSATGIELPAAPARHRPPRSWRMAAPYLAGIAIRAVRGPDRGAAVAEAAHAVGSRAAGAAHSWSDPMPGVAFFATTVRHPGGLVRPFLDS